MSHKTRHTNVTELASLASELGHIRADMLALEREMIAPLDDRDAVSLPSIRNFVHYLALRRHDLRPMQELLERSGLSSLGRAESHTLASVDAVLAVIARLRGTTFTPEPSEGAPSFDDGYVRLAENTRALFGVSDGHRDVRIMVTLPADAALDRTLVRTLIEKGTDLVRINCAHDDVETWRAMVANVRAASTEAHRTCLVEMELAGPKLRTTRDFAGKLRTSDLVILSRESLSLPEVLDQVHVGERVFFDDGKIGGTIEQVLDDVPEPRVSVRITQAKSTGRALRADKGVNFPDSRLELPALTGKDREDLRFVAEHADVVGMSFVQSERDVVDLLRALDDLQVPRSRGLLLKIETKRGFRELPRILLAAMGVRPVGVMIARGDLAVEVGYDRLAEVQEEILWLCEAAHVPVIWATQVLERLAKKGLPTRAEITDAAMSERAECVMLNKGPHIVDAVVLLDDILRRMHAHQRKKSSRLRPLAVSRF